MATYQAKQLDRGQVWDKKEEWVLIRWLLGLGSNSLHWKKSRWLDQLLLRKRRHRLSGSDFSLPVFRLPAAFDAL